MLNLPGEGIGSCASLWDVERYSETASTFLVTTTRWGGSVEGGLWAAFLVSDRGDGCFELPDEAFMRSQEVEWWMCGPSIPTATGDTPEDALANLRHLLNTPGVPRFALGEQVRIDRAPGELRHDGVGAVVDSVQEPRMGRFAPPGATEWEYIIEFDDGTQRKVPEPFVRLARSTT